MNHFRVSAAALGLALSVGTMTVADIPSHTLMVAGVDEDNVRQVWLFHPEDGSLVKEAFIEEVPGVSIPRAIQVGDVIWVGVQAGSTGNKIHRYNLDGSYIDEFNHCSPDATTTQVRGMFIQGESVFVVVSTATGGCGPALVEYDFDANYIDHFAINTLAFHPLDYNGEWLVGHSSTANRIQRYAYDGTWLGQFLAVHTSVNPSFSGQLIEHNGNVLVAAPSGDDTTRGIHEYDSAGVMLNFIPNHNTISEVGGPRGIHVLGDGNYLMANSGGVHIWNTTTETWSSVVVGFDAYNIEPLIIPDDPKPACPGDLTGDGVVNVFDLLDLLSAWGPCADPEDCPADLNGDGVVNVFDLLDLLSAWGPCP